MFEVDQIKNKNSIFIDLNRQWVIPFTVSAYRNNNMNKT